MWEGFRAFGHIQKTPCRTTAWSHVCRYMKTGNTKVRKKIIFVKFISILNSLKHQKINLLCLVECICHAHYSCRGKWALMNSVLFLQNTCCSWVSLSWRQQYRKCLFPQRVFQIAVVMLNWFWCGRWGNTPEVNWLFMLGTLPRLPFLCP